MAKKFVFDALTTALGDFVDGFSEENLKLGIWSGKVRVVDYDLVFQPHLDTLTIWARCHILTQVELNNVAINVKKLRDLNLPVNIYAGSVEELSVDIPWASLATKPVKVTNDMPPKPFESCALCAPLLRQPTAAALKLQTTSKMRRFSTPFYAPRRSPSRASISSRVHSKRAT